MGGWGVCLCVCVCVCVFMIECECATTAQDRCHSNESEGTFS